MMLPSSLPLLWEGELGSEQRESKAYVCVYVHGERENTSLLCKEKGK